MRDYLGIWIFDCGEEPFGHFGALHVHVGMDGGDDDVQLGEHFVVEIELAVFQNIYFDARQQTDAGDARLSGANLFDVARAYAFRPFHLRR